MMVLVMKMNIAKIAQFRQNCMASLIHSILGNTKDSGTITLGEPLVEKGIDQKTILSLLAETHSA